MVGHALAELEDAQAQVVAAAVRLIVHEAVAGQGTQQAVGGAERELRPAGQLGGTGAPRLVAQQDQQAQRLADHVRPGVLLAGLGAGLSAGCRVIARGGREGRRRPRPLLWLDSHSWLDALT